MGVERSQFAGTLVRMKTPSEADVNCAGFIDSLSPEVGGGKGGAAVNFASGGLNTPNTTKFVDGDIVYLSGNGYKVGQKLMLERELSHFSRYALFPGQAAAIRALGQPYADLAQVHIVDTRSRMAIAHVDYSCEPVAPGDLVMPFEQRGMVAAREGFAFDRFAPAGVGLKGRIVLARDSAELLGPGAAVYLNVGAGQGVKVGDYFRVSRTYGADLLDAADSLSFKAAEGEDNQKHPARMESGSKTAGAPKKLSGRHGKRPLIDIADMPRRGLGELVIVKVTATSATGVIGFALEELHVGDDVERESGAQ